MPIFHASLTDEELNRLFVEAFKAQTEERFIEATEKYSLLLEYFPQAAILHYNLGLVYFSLEDFAGALNQFSLALLDQPEDNDILFNVALCQKKTGESECAIVTYEKLLETMPESTDCWYNLAGCYRDTFADEQAIACYRKVLVLESDYLPALNNLAYLYHRCGDMQDAEICYRQLLTMRPDDEAAQYLLDSLLGTSLTHAPDAYISRFFDGYAERFEKNLVGLGYDNPRQLYELLVEYSKDKEIKKAYGHGLDLGCGTGLGGIAFKQMVAIFHGVDLSENMLLQARGKKCYAGLYQDSISHYLQTTPETYDFFLATDVFIYVGELREIFSFIKGIARPQALFCFSTEGLESTGYRLQKTGRFAYSRNYIMETAAATGWTILAIETTRLRKEREQWVAGDLWIVQVNS